MSVQLSFDQENKQWVGVLEGDLDALQAPKLIATIQETMQETPADVVLDCTRLDFVDSMGLGALVKCRKMMEKFGHGIRMLHMKQRIYKLFVITGLENSFDIGVEQ